MLTQLGSAPFDRVAVLVAQEEPLLLGKEDVKEALQVHLVLHDAPNVELVIKLAMKIVLLLLALVHGAAKAHNALKHLGESLLRCIFEFRSFTCQAFHVGPV